MPKIVSFNPPTVEGIGLEFDEPVCLNGGIATTEWWLSWDEISDLISGGLEFRKMKGQQNEQRDRKTN